MGPAAVALPGPLGPGPAALLLPGLFDPGLLPGLFDPGRAAFGVPGALGPDPAGSARTSRRSRSRARPPGVLALGGRAEAARARSARRSWRRSLTHCGRPWGQAMATVSTKPA